MEDRQMKVGIWFYGLGTVLTGILNIAWGSFDASHQPIQSLGVSLPAQHILAYVAGVWLVAAGLAILWRRSARIGAAASAIAYLIFAALWLARYYAGIHALGWRIDVLLGVTFGLAQQVMLIAPVAFVYASPPHPIPCCKREQLSPHVGCSDCLLSSSAYFTSSAFASSRPSSRTGCRSDIFGRR